MNYLKKTCAITLSTAMILGLAGNVGTISCAASDVEKEETVYVNQKADGEVESVTVSDWLKNVTGNSDISDVSNLTDIKNVKGDENFTKGNEDTLTWNADDNDIYYQGTSNEEVPVGINITYKLDGVETKPEDLTGKSGKLVITLQYKNNAIYEDEIDGRKTELNVPFLMASAMILPVDTFSNVTINQGKVVSEGSNQILIAYGMPGLIESLNLSKDIKNEMNEKFSDTVTITADVEKFSMGSIYTVATSEEFADIDLNDDSDMNDLENAVNDLVNATDELISGSSDLSDGLKKLQDNFKTYANAVGKVNKGASDLSTGASKLSKGVTKYTKGVSTITNGAGQYVAGAKQLADGVSAYIEGEQQLDAGITSLNGKVGELSAYSEFNSGLQQYTGKVTELASAIKNMGGFVGNIQTVAHKCGSAAEKLKSAQGVSQDDVETIKQLLNSDELDENQKSALNKLLDSTNSQQNAIGNALEDLSSANTTLTSANVSLPETEQLDALITNGAALTEKSAEVNAGIQKLNDSKEGVPALYAGVKELSRNNDALLTGAQNLNVNGATLTDGINTLNANTKSLTDSAKQLSTGAGKLFSGSSKLNNSTKEVTEGIDKLQKGSVDLLDGMNRFKDEGTGKLQNEYNNNIKNVIERFRSLISGADEYKSFSGIADDMDGSVKFIFQTAEIKAEDK